MKSNRVIWGLVALVVLTTISVTFGTLNGSIHLNGSIQRKIANHVETTPTPETKDKRDLTKYGIVDYNAPQIENQAEWDRRRQISQRYDNQGWVYKLQNAEPGGIGKITDDPPPPLFPIEESTLIVVGEIVSVNTFLSNDKGGVYTEFTIRVGDVLKNKESKNVKEVTADREGGVVVYPNGGRVLYQNSSVGLPRLGSKYLFFLTKDGLSPNYEILTSYDITGDRIHQMEMGRPFDEFKNSNKTTFIETVRNKIGRLRSQ